MIKKYKDYIILLLIFLLIIFIPYINKFLYAFDYKLNEENITNLYCQSLEVDYNALLEANDLKVGNGLNLVISKVLIRDIYDFTDTITIYKGQDANLEKGQAVIDDAGLIGVISEVFKTTSQVQLLTNKNSYISVKIGSSYGILSFHDGTLLVKDLQVYDEINRGDKIYTSGIGNLPGDIYIGEVADISIDATEIEKTVSVKPAVDFANINYVLVVD